MCILIIDDNRDTRDSIKLLLETRGYTGVRTAGSGREALNFLQSANAETIASVDAIILDVNMPGMSGLTVCEQIKADERLRDIPVLVLTGLPDDATLERAFASGAIDFVTKAGSPTELLARVRSVRRLKLELDNRKARERELVQVTRQLKELNLELQRLSILDELTGIANRRFFNILFNQEWARATREMLPLSMIMIDIDYFKHYNDFYGHPQGDKCLSQVAATLNSIAKRPGDYVARYGGEEFVALLSHTDLDGALVVAEKLRRKVEDLRLEHAKSAASDHVTISLGVASAIPERGSYSELLILAADQALYKAKASGRNRVMYYEGPLAELGTGMPHDTPRPRNLRTWKTAGA